jgi:hypothetical protein
MSAVPEIREAKPADAPSLERWIVRDSGQESDFSVFFHNPLNVCLIAGDGGAFFVWHGPGIYETHVAFEQRGKAVLDLSHRMLAHMRDRHGARTFWAAVPHNETKESRKVRLFTRLMRWKPLGFADLPHGRCQLFMGE